MTYRIPINAASGTSFHDLTGFGRHLRVIYVPEPENVFAITIYNLSGKALIAYRRRIKRRK